ncbi:cytochrome b [Falsirhodobacter xinxiangensis]|uniref:cytochrome b n=1 Tax=Falsirhodobacter xinxiangensis TaxID=2530049 RepID=UPI0010AAA758|nr:cytochrome b [Rhodobacter xinxiangensis]
MATGEWHDSAARFGRASRILHWGAAVLLLWQFLILAGYGLTGGSPLLDRIASFGPSHGSVGLMLLALTLPRLIWSLRQRGGRPPLGWLARAFHAALYAIMLAIPLLGLLRAYGSGKGWHHWGVQIVPETGTEIPWMIRAADLAHGELGWALLAMIAGHAGMACFHQFWMRDRVLSRMVGPIRD